jgi:protocatechuate 3,4-dioxygenase beta subunit
MVYRQGGDVIPSRTVMSGESMVTQRWWLAVLAGMALWAAGHVSAAAAETACCTGMTVDERGSPVPGATVELYCVRVLPGGLVPTLICAATSDAGGSFRLATTPPRLPSRFGYLEVLAENAGYGLGWERWEPGTPTRCKVVLHQPVTLNGRITDADGRAIQDADVSIAWINFPEAGALHCIWGRLSAQRFSTRTATQGQFRFEQIPQKGRPAVFVQKAGWAGQFWSQDEAAEPTGDDREVRIVLQPEARVEGRVVEKATGRPIGGIRLTTCPEPSSTPGSTATSQVDGTFVLTGLRAGQCAIFLETSGDQAMEWAATSLKVEVAAGQTTGNVQFELIRGGVLDITVTDKTWSLGIPGCITRIPCSDRTCLLVSDSQGKAWLRLLPGEYDVQLYPTQGYVQDCLQVSAVIREDMPRRLAFHLPPGQPRKAQMYYIRGTVLDAAGKAAEGVKLDVCPGGKAVTSDCQGRFELDWQTWDPNQTKGLLFAQDQAHDLAAAVDVEAGTAELEVRLQPGMVLTGRVVDLKGRPLARAFTSFTLSGPRWSRTGGVMTGSNGRFRVSGLAQGYEYSVAAEATGFGRTSKTVGAAEAVPGVKDVGNLALQAASLSITGIVTDGDGKPARNARISVSGAGQPNLPEVRSDSQGRFTIEGVCSGPIEITASVWGSARVWGSAQTCGGARDVRIVVHPPQGQ